LEPIRSNIIPTQLTSSNTNPIKLEVGHRFMAVIGKIQGNQAQILIGREMLIGQLPNNHSLKPGPVPVQISQINPNLELSIQKPTPSIQSPSAQTFLKTVIPNQTPLPKTFEAMSQLLQNQQLPVSIQGPLKQFLDNLLKPLLKNTATFKQGLRNSGLFLENKLKVSSQTGKDQPMNNDLKAQLFQLRKASMDASATHSLNKGLKSLAGLSEQAINRISMLQLQGQDTAGIPGFEFIQKDSDHLIKNFIKFIKKTEDQPASWEVWIELNHNDKEVIIKTKFNEPDKISFLIWSSLQNTESFQSQRIEEFKNYLKQNEQLDIDIWMTTFKPEQPKKQSNKLLINIKT